MCLSDHKRLSLNWQPDFVFLWRNFGRWSNAKNSVSSSEPILYLQKVCSHYVLLSLIVQHLKLSIYVTLASRPRDVDAENTNRHFRINYEKKTILEGLLLGNCSETFLMLEPTDTRAHMSVSESEMFSLFLSILHGVSTRVLWIPGLCLP